MASFWRLRGNPLDIMLSYVHITEVRWDSETNTVHRWLQTSQCLEFSIYPCDSRMNGLRISLATYLLDASRIRIRQASRRQSQLVPIGRVRIFQVGLKACPARLILEDLYIRKLHSMSECSHYRVRTTRLFGQANRAADTKSCEMIAP